MPTINLSPRDVARELARRYSTMTHEVAKVQVRIFAEKKSEAVYARQMRTCSLCSRLIAALPPKLIRSEL